MVKTRTSVLEIPGSIPTRYEFSVVGALLVFSKYLSRLLYTKHNEPALGQNTKQQQSKKEGDIPWKSILMEFLSSNQMLYLNTHN